MMRKVFLFDWGDTIMRNFPCETGKMNTWKKVDTMPNAQEMLKKLSKSYDCYIATNAKDSFKKDIIEALERVKINKFFKDIFCFNEIGFLKPSSEYFDKIIRQLDVTKAEIVMIGDNLETDIRGAQENGIESILYDYNNNHQDYNGNRITNLLEILELYSIQIN